MIHKIDETAQYLQYRMLGREMPKIAIILGSGLGLMADRIENPLTIPYSEIPNFKRSTAVGHKGNLIIGTLGSGTPHAWVLAVVNGEDKFFDPTAEKNATSKTDTYTTERFY